MIPNAVMYRADITSDAKLVYGYLKYLAWKSDSNEVDPARDVIALYLGISERSVGNALKLLRATSCVYDDDSAPKLVAAARRGLGKTNVYVINDPESAPPLVRNTSNDQKDEARAIMSRAIKRGELIPDLCLECGGPDTEGHHEDYTKPLDVVWLCRPHHREWDKRRREAESAALEQQDLLPGSDEVAAPKQPNSADPSRVRDPLPDLKPKTKDLKHSSFQPIQEAWLSAPGTVQHRESYFEDASVRGKVTKAVAKYGVDDVVTAIRSYAAVVESPAHYWNHRWTFGDFLQRGLDRFIPEANPLLVFKTERNGVGKSRGLSSDEIRELGRKMTAS